MKKIDIFTHILPKAYNKKMMQLNPEGADINKRVRDGTGIVDLDDRFKVMDRFGDYAQIINLVTPPIESFGPPSVSNEMARLANDGMADLVGKYADRFPGFVASLPMNDPEGRNLYFTAQGLEGIDHQGHGETHCTGHCKGGRADRQDLP